MNIPLSRLPLTALRIALAFAISSTVLTSCVAPGYGYGYGGYSVDYYEPFGGVYGAWGPGYDVGPYRDGGHWRGHNSGGHPYRAAPASRSMPSIPSGRSGRGSAMHR